MVVGNRQGGMPRYIRFYQSWRKIQTYKEDNQSNTLTAALRLSYRSLNNSSMKVLSTSVSETEFSPVPKDMFHTADNSPMRTSSFPSKEV